MSIDYVLGFAFNERRQVVLIKKTKPAWQRGRWNGVGGKVEDDDLSPAQAMSREFYEETGVMIESSFWTRRGMLMNGDIWSCHVFTVTSEATNKVETRTDQEVRLVTQAEVMHREDLLIENIPSLIDLCLMRKDHTGWVPYFTLDYAKL